MKLLRRNEDLSRAKPTDDLCLVFSPRPIEITFLASTNFPTGEKFIFLHFQTAQIRDSTATMSAIDNVTQEDSAVSASAVSISAWDARKAQSFIGEGKVLLIYELVKGLFFE